MQFSASNAVQVEEEREEESGPDFISLKCTEKQQETIIQESKKNYTYLFCLSFDTYFEFAYKFYKSFVICKGTMKTGGNLVPSLAGFYYDNLDFVFNLL